MSTPSLFSDKRELLPFDGSALLIPHFISSVESTKLFTQLNEETPWEMPEMVMFGKKYPQAGFSTWFTDTNVSYVYSGITRTPHAMTPLLQDVMRQCALASGAEYNSVLVNLYRDGNDSVSWHSDNEEINGSEPTIASVSLGATRRFDLRHKATGDGRAIATLLGASDCKDQSQGWASHQLDVSTSRYFAAVLTRCAA